MPGTAPEPERKDTSCAEGERSVRFIVNEGLTSAEIEIACLRPDELDRGMTVVVTNVATHEVRCGGTWEDGRFRVPVPASVGDRIDVQVPTGHQCLQDLSCDFFR